MAQVAWGTMHGIGLPLDISVGQGASNHHGQYLQLKFRKNLLKVLLYQLLHLQVDTPGFRS